MNRIDGMPFIWASCNAPTCGSEMCSQRPYVSSGTSETGTLQSSQKCQQWGSKATADFIFISQLFFQQQLLPHTCDMRCHLSPGYSPLSAGPWQCDIICMWDDCARLCCYFSFLFLSSFHALPPFSQSEFAWCDIFQVRGWKRVCRFVLWLLQLWLSS